MDLAVNGEMLIEGHLVWRNPDETDLATGEKLVNLGYCHKDRRECGAAVLGYGKTVDEAFANAKLNLERQYKMLGALAEAGVPVVNLLGQPV